MSNPTLYNARGDVITPKMKMALGLYPSPRYNPHNYRPRVYNVTDTNKSVTKTDHQSQLKYGRSLFASSADIGGAIISKAGWCVGPSAFSPIYSGPTDQQDWGNIVEQWLMDSFYPVCNIAGPNFDFATSLNLSSIALDVDGDTLCVLTSNRNGFPQFAMIPSHKIGNRHVADGLVKDGKYKGNEIYNGVIISSNGRPIAYRILGETEEDDYDLPAQSCSFLYEPEWSDQYRGISRIARPLTDLMDQQDIDEFLKQGVKLASTLGLLHSTESGTPDASANLVGVDEDESVVTGIPQGPPFEILNGGEIMYFKANAGEKIESLKDERPSQNTAAFIERIQRRALFSIGWPIELLDPSKIGGASVRLVQDLARKTIANRQITLERRARFIVKYAVAMGMQNGFIPQNNKDWYSWSFTKGSVISVDNGNESNMDREGLKIGTTNLSEIASKKGLDWQELRQQTQRETEDLLIRAQFISQKYSIPMTSALTLLSQRNPNASVELIKQENEPKVINTTGQTN